MSVEPISPEKLSEAGGSQLEPLTQTDAMAGTFTSPSDTFETIAYTPVKNYWIIPILIAVVLGLITSYLFMSDKELTSKTMEKQKEKMMEKFEQNIKDGKMTKEDAEKAMETMNPESIFFKIFGYGGAIALPFLTLLILSFIYLIIFKLMKAHFDFKNILNVVGLAMLISAVGGILSIVISIIKGDFATIGPGLFLSENSVGEKIYSLLLKIDLFSIWFYAVIAVGLSRISRIDILKTASFVFGVWIIYIAATSFIF